MTTPFLSISNAFREVRLYTEFDPYIYYVDNRPLQDLMENSQVLSNASDAARRAALIGDLGLSSVLSGLVGPGKKVVGLTATNPSAGVVTLAPGALLSSQPVLSGSPQTVLKHASLPDATNLSCPAPATLGKEVRFLIQARHRDFEGSATYLAYDPANTFLPSSLLNGWLEVSVLAGAEANTGSSVAPTATPGWEPLFVVLSQAGNTVSTISTASGAPARVQALVTESAWVSPSLTNSWVAAAGFQAPQYRKIGDKVQIRGAISGGTAATAAFTLPTGFRPLATNTFLASTGSASGVVAVTVAASGAVSPLSSSMCHMGLIEFYVN